MIIDIHGHYTTAPKALEDWRNRQIAGIKDPSAMPKVSELKISDDELRESIESQPAEEDEGARLRPHHLFAARQLHGPPHRRLQCQQHLGGDLQRAVLPRRAALPGQLHRRGHAAAVARRRSEDLHPELEKCVREYGFVGINLNPIPPAATGPRRR
jgi:4-oxalmesaconate hydratase